MKYWKSVVIVLIGLAYGTPGVHVSSYLIPRHTNFTAIVYADVGKPVDVDWETLEGLDYRTGRLSPALKKLNGALVRVPGFIVPLEDSETAVSEFLLVPYFGACIHVPPPPPNQIVHVRMEKGRKLTFDFWQPLWVHGRLKVAKTTSPYGDTAYEMTGLRSEPLEEEPTQ
jgi:hypothetical protein